MDRSRLAIALANFVALAALAIVAIVAAYVAGRGTMADGVRLRTRDVVDLPGWADGDQAPALAAFLRSCAASEGRADNDPLDAQVHAPTLLALYGRVADWRPVCAAAARLPPSDEGAVRHFFDAEFVAVQVSQSGRPDGLLTGYYEPELNGSRQRSDEFHVPLLRLPPDLVSVELGAFRDGLKGERIAGRVVGQRLEPYETRAEIVGGAPASSNQVLLWVDDPIAAFFLQVQGSGRVRLTDGSILRVGYAGFNGHEYTAIGRVLVNWGELRREDVSLQSITAWLERHPQRAAELMNHNASYVYFREIDVPDPALGAMGAQGVPLTPGRSLAVDRRFVALGLPVWVDGSRPDATEASTRRPLRRLMVAQDSGGAIRGAQRADVFWGFGDEAANIAGPMAEPGRLYVLVPRLVARRQGWGD